MERIQEPQAGEGLCETRSSGVLPPCSRKRSSCPYPCRVTLSLHPHKWGRYLTRPPHSSLRVYGGENQGSRDGSAAKRSYWFCRGSKFSSQRLCWADHNRQVPQNSGQMANCGCLLVQAGRVRLCASYLASYHSTFPATGLCFSSPVSVFYIALPFPTCIPLAAFALWFSWVSWST